MSQCKGSCNCTRNLKASKAINFKASAENKETITDDTKPKTATVACDARKQTNFWSDVTVFVELGNKIVKYAKEQQMKAGASSEDETTTDTTCDSDFESGEDSRGSRKERCDLGAGGGTFEGGLYPPMSFNASSTLSRTPIPQWASTPKTIRGGISNVNCGVACCQCPRNTTTFGDFADSSIQNHPTFGGTYAAGSPRCRQTRIGGAGGGTFTMGPTRTGGAGGGTFTMGKTRTGGAGGGTFTMGQNRIGGAGGGTFTVGQTGTGGAGGGTFNMGQTRTGGAGGGTFNMGTRSGGAAGATFNLGATRSGGAAGTTFNMGTTRSGGAAGTTFNVGQRSRGAAGTTRSGGASRTFDMGRSRSGTCGSGCPNDTFDGAGGELFDMDGGPPVFSGLATAGSDPWGSPSGGFGGGFGGGSHFASPGPFSQADNIEFDSEEWIPAEDVINQESLPLGGYEEVSFNLAENDIQVPEEWLQYESSFPAPILPYRPYCMGGIQDEHDEMCELADRTNPRSHTGQTDTTMSSFCRSPIYTSPAIHTSTPARDHHSPHFETNSTRCSSRN